MKQRRIRRQAGRSAQRLYRQRLQVWRRQLRPGLIIALVVLLLASALTTAALLPSGGLLIAGACVSSALTMLWCAWDTPPDHVARWREGAMGERRTARVLRTLERDGWVVLA